LKLEVWGKSTKGGEVDGDGKLVEGVGEEAPTDFLLGKLCERGLKRKAKTAVVILERKARTRGICDQTI